MVFLHGRRWIAPWWFFLIVHRNRRDLFMAKRVFIARMAPPC